MRRILSLVLFSVAALPLGCSSEPGEDANQPGPEGCAAGYQDCGGFCVDLSGDGMNCGACGTSCAADQVCSTGVCQTGGCVEPGRTQCDASCVDLMTNPSHCGACGVFCSAGQTCQSGLCVDAGTGGSGTGGAGVGTGGDLSGSGGLGTGGTDVGAGGQGTGGALSTDVIIQEGETGQCDVDGIIESTNGGFSGSGYLNSDNAAGAGIEWAVSVGEAGTYSLGFAYANGGAEDRPADVLVGGAVASSGLSFPSTTDWTSWSTASVDVMLAAGENRIVLRATSAAGLSNIDSLTVSGAAVAALDCGGNVGTGGMDGTGGMGSGGMGSGGTGTGGSGGDGGLADDYPCDGSTDGYDYVIDGSGNSHTVNGSGSYSFEQAYSTALGSGNRSVLVLSSGDVSSGSQIRIRENTLLNVCGTINVTNSGGGSDRSPAFARSASNIRIPHFNLTGVAQYGMFFREVHDVHLGEININGTGGLGIRIDNNPSNNCWGTCNQNTNITIDTVNVSNTGGHGVETYGVDGLTIGTVTARNVTNAGLLLNATINATVGMVDGEDVATGNGYATFRVANQAGKIGSSWPAGNIHVGTVRSRRGGRGIFCVSDSGGTTIDNVDLANNGNNSMLLENCHNFRVAASSGTVSSGGAIIITQRSDEHTPTSNVTLQNLTVNGTTVDGRCGLGSGNVICNLSGNYSVPGGACLTNQNSCP